MKRLQLYVLELKIYLKAIVIKSLCLKRKKKNFMKKSSVLKYDINLIILKSSLKILNSEVLNGNYSEKGKKSHNF